MSRTYVAILKGGRIVQWRGNEPDPAEALEVQITVLNDAPPSDNSQRRQQIISALEQLADRGTFSELTDARRWQQEQRQDRPLAGRESETK